jgi:hypothetical protein
VKKVYTTWNSPCFITPQFENEFYLKCLFISTLRYLSLRYKLIHSLVLPSLCVFVTATEVLKFLSKYFYSADSCVLWLHVHAFQQSKQVLRFQVMFLWILNNNLTFLCDMSTLLTKVTNQWMVISWHLKCWCSGFS